MTGASDTGPDMPSHAMEHTTTVAIAGIPLVVTSNSKAVLTAFAARYDLATAPTNEAVGCTSRIVVTPGGDPGDAQGRPQWDFGDEPRITATGRGFSAAIDMNLGAVTATVSEAFVRGNPHFRTTVLEGASLLAINRKDRHPVHAATVRQGDAAIVLCGSSGVGKSTLAYVADRAGFDVLADDSTRVQLTPSLRVWGEGQRPIVHLLSSVRRQRSELRDLEPDWLSSHGEAKLSVRVRARALTPPCASAVRVCLLSRDRSGLWRRPATPREIEDAIVNAPEAVADRAPEQRIRVAAALAAPGGWRLNLSSQPEDAIPQLREMFASLTVPSRRAIPEE